MGACDGKEGDEDGSLHFEDWELVGLRRGLNIMN